MRQQDPPLDTAGPSIRKSSVAESEVPADDERMIDGGPGYPVDGIKEQKPCELHQKVKNLSLKVAVGCALPCPHDARWHGREIPAGFAKVGVDEIVTGFESMELPIPGPEGERTLGEVLGGIILWEKNNIKLPGSAPTPTPPPSRGRSPAPPSPPRSPPHDYDQHNTSPSRSPPQGPPSSPPPLPAKDNKRKRANRRISPKRQLSPLPSVPHKNLPIRAYDRTDEENAAIAEAEKDAHFQKKKPEPTPVYTEKEKTYALGFLNTKSQYELHHKPDDYVRTLQKEAQKSKSSRSASGSKKGCSPARKSSRSARRDVPQLGKQAKQSIPPLKVLSKHAPQPPQLDMVTATEIAAAMGVTVAQLLSSEDDKLPKADVVPTYVPGQPLVSKEKLQQLPTQMRNLHEWYLRAVKGGRTMIVAKVPHEYYFRPEEVHVDFPELFQLYNFDALNKSLMSCYYL